MGLLDQLWDDTVAGPRPESGLGKLRKHSTFAFRSNSGKEVESDGGNVRSYGGDLTEEAKSVTRSIMIIKPRGNQTVGNGSAPASPAGSTPPSKKVLISRGAFVDFGYVDISVGPKRHSVGPHVSIRVAPLSTFFLTKG
ncbi:Dormancyauxin associated [Macleaya cordata]|uniref:Dormancyauxin associated n=1 Tax=Macleaya cordata TaxID=56857 RepID=A0A200PWN4_MACCD|nr:Dormancyauxin associated [Macleaya cordata]